MPAITNVNIVNSRRCVFFWRYCPEFILTAILSQLQLGSTQHACSPIQRSVSFVFTGGRSMAGLTSVPFLAVDHRILHWEKKRSKSMGRT